MRLQLFHEITEWDILVETIHNIYMCMCVSECYFNHRSTKTCVYSIYLLYVTLEKMNKINCIFWQLTHTQFYDHCHKQYNNECCWLSFQLYKLLTLQNFNALLINLHFFHTIDILSICDGNITFCLSLPTWYI